MNILGIDTTTKSASCSILKEDKYYTKSISNEITHSEKLLPIIDETMNESGISLKDIDIFATINGPGSFTGIRIGLATIKAFAQVIEKDIFSISSIDLISYVAYMNTKANEEKYILSLIDARNNRVYYGLNKLYKNSEGKIVIEKIIDVSNDLIEDAIENVKEYINDKEIIIAGNYIVDLLSSYSDSILNIYPTTNDLINCYLNISNVSDYMYNAYSLDALYARPSQAERMAKNG